MKKGKVLKVLISFCAMFTMSFTAFAKGKTQNLKDVLKDDYKIEYASVLDLQKNLEEGLIKSQNGEKAKEEIKQQFKFGTCLGYLFKDEMTLANKKEKFKDFIYKNFVEKKFDFVNYDKAVFKQFKEYFEQTEKKIDSIIKDFSKFSKDGKLSEDLEGFLKISFNGMILQQGMLGENEAVEKIKKDFKNKNSKFYKAFVEEVKKILEYLNKNFKGAIKILKEFENDKNMRKAINEYIKKIDLKEYYNMIVSQSKFFKKSDNFEKNLDEKSLKKIDDEEKNENKNVLKDLKLKDLKLKDLKSENVKKNILKKVKNNKKKKRFLKK